MEAGIEQLTDGHLLAGIDAALDALNDDRLRLPTDRELLDLLLAALRVDARLRAWQHQLAARIEANAAAWNEHRTSTTTWLAEAANLTPKEAARLIKAGQDLARFPIVGAAAGAGKVLPAQAEAITSVLRTLPGEFPTEVVADAQELLVGFAANHGLLAMINHHTHQALAPGNGGDRPRIDVTLSYDHLIRLGHTTGLLDNNGCHREAGNPAGSWRDTGLNGDNAPSQEPGTRRTPGGRARLVSTGEPLAPSAVRQLLCDADILPVILGGPSEILDVGRTQRLVTPAIRAALDLRDGGCIFPACDKPPDACHAHHTTPWRLGGTTSLTTLVLVCPHHHGIVEPGPDPAADRWQVRLRPDGIPEVIPPRRVDPHQRPRTHARFHLQRE